ncbi:MAG: hypothetical protein IKH16_02890 [Selenomonadaceae bacterium]|nr:hypothetical protein [Selenomonadaceae bacterium]
MNGSERGFSCLEVVIAVGISFLVLGSVATVGRKFFMEALIDYEVARIVSDLRWVQEHDRTVYYYGGRYFPDASPIQWNHMWIMIWADSYSVRGYRTKWWCHECFPGIRLENSSRNKEIKFKGNGNTSNLLTIFVYYTMGGKRFGKYVIVDAVGRIRVDRRPP